MVAVFTWVAWNLGHDKCLTLARDNKIEIFCKMALSNDDSFGWHTANETTHADNERFCSSFFFFINVKDLHGGSFDNLVIFISISRKMLFFS